MEHSSFVWHVLAPQKRHAAYPIGVLSVFKTIVLFGLPGSGKSTVARMICRLTHSVHFDSDRFAGAFRDAGLDVEHAFQTAVKQIMDILGDAPTEHCSLIISDSLSRTDSWNHLFETQRRENLCITLIKVDCSVDTALSRVVQREGRHIMENDDVSIRLAQDFYSKLNHEYFTVWNGDGADIDQVAREALKLSELNMAA